MYYTGVNPLNGEKIYVCRNQHEKAMQRALIQYRLPENYDLVKEALLKCHREDLIGFDRNCLIPPRNIKGKSKVKDSSSSKNPKVTANKTKKGNKK